MKDIWNDVIGINMYQYKFELNGNFLNCYLMYRAGSIIVTVKNYETVQI